MSMQREEVRKQQQGYDPDTPRCGTCLYFTMGSCRERALARKTHRSTEALQRCTFGDFQTTPIGLCDEWRNRKGEMLARPGEDE